MSVDTTIPVKINTLFRCENVSDIYYFINYNVVNMATGHVKAISRMSYKKGYPYVTLETKNKTRNKKVLMHHLVALAYIENKPYEVIEHLDDNAENYCVDNLIFSTQKANILRASENGLMKNPERTFRVTLKNGEVHVGTILELQAKLKIPKQTMYCRFYLGGPGKKIKSVEVVVEDEQTIPSGNTDRDDNCQEVCES